MKNRILLVTATVWLGIKVIGFAQPAVLQFSSAQYTTSETGEIAIITVEITWGDPFNVYTVDYATSSGSATAGVDYSERRGTLSFEYPETNKAFTIPILDDSLAEGDEMLLLTLRNPAFDASLGRSNAMLTIRDD